MASKLFFVEDIFDHLPGVEFEELCTLAPIDPPGSYLVMAKGNLIRLGGPSPVMQCQIRLDVFSLQQHLGRDEVFLSFPSAVELTTARPLTFSLLQAVTFPADPSPLPPRRAILSARKTLGDGNAGIDKVRMFALSVDELVATTTGFPFPAPPPP